MYRTILSLIGFLSISSIGLSQLDQFESTLESYFSRPADDGWMYFTEPNNFQAGACFEYYKTVNNDTKNDMLLLNVGEDSLAHYTHYKYQQLYMNVPVEGAGCIEHFNTEGSLVFTNAKHAIDILENVNPSYNSEEILTVLLGQLPSGLAFAWDDPSWEQQIRHDKQDSFATWYPVPELILAVKEVKDMHGDIPGTRYQLTYKISITTIAPEVETLLYYVNAHTGAIVKKRSTEIDNVQADITGYGNREIDVTWQGGFVQKFYLRADDAGHNIHTRKFEANNGVWDNLNDTQSGQNNWGSTYLTETSAHYHVTRTWDYFKFDFGRAGFDGLGSEIRVGTQWGNINAAFGTSQLPDGLRFGYSPSNYSFGDEPSVVAHEYVHGITKHTANLVYEYESGALNESFSDIFGIAYQAFVLDNWSTDWIFGNFIPNDITFTRSFDAPQARGLHWTGFYNINNDPTYTLGQPKKYSDVYWCSQCPYDVDNGGVHINSGVQNQWFYILTEGNTNVQGIGMTKATRIAYYALTSILNSSAQYYDSKNATIEAAKILYGECSQEHISTAKAWNAVNLLAGNPCPSASIEDVPNEEDILIYPNPTNGIVSFEISRKLDDVVKLYDVKGKLIKELEVKTTHYQENFTNLEGGTYFLHFKINGGTIVKRIVIE